MPIIASGKSKSFEPCPAGVQQGVCCDVVDLGLLETPWGPKRKVEIRWQSNDLMPVGDKPYLINKRYTLSLNEKANLRHDLEAWRGKPFTETELEAFDLEKLIGVNALLNIVHKQGTKGGMFANVASIMPLAKSMPKIQVSADYVRVVNREDEPEPNETPDDIDEAMPTYREEVPF